MNNFSEPSRACGRPAEVANTLNGGSAAQTNMPTFPDSSEHTIKQGERLENSAMQLMGALREDAKNCSCTPSFTAFYDNKNKEFLVKNNRGIWIRQVDSQMSLHLRNANFSMEKLKNETLSAFEREKLRIIKECGVEYAGPLAGYQEGFCKEKSWLITQSPNLLAPKCGKWDTLRLVLEAIFADDYPQLDYIYGWLKVSLEALYAGQSFPRQALVFAGERGCGKSFFQNIITALRGGRCAKPYASMGGEKFNGELFGAEHLMIEDEVPHTDMRARKAFGSKIKQLTSSEMQRCNYKHQEAIMLSPRWHLTISLNDEPEDLGVLPSMDSGIADKMMLFKAHKRPFPMPTGTLEERKIFKERVWAELPAFVHWLLREFIIPADLRCERFGVLHFHHPEILAALYELSDEIRFLDLIDTHLGYALPQSLTAREWERMLRERCLRDEVDRLFRHTKTCGNYLGRLARLHPERVRSERTRVRREWVILPAADEMDVCDGCGDGKKWQKTPEKADL